MDSSLTGTNLTQSFFAPVRLEPGSATTTGAYSFTNNSATASNRMQVSGGVTGGTTIAAGANIDAPGNGGAIVLSLAGTNTGANTVSGVIADGGAGSNVTGRGLSVLKTGTGTWNLTGTNTYTGNLEITGGILNVASVSNYGVASAIGARTLAAESSSSNIGIGLLIRGGTLQYTGSTAQSTNRNIRLGVGTNTIDASGTGGGTLSFTKSGSNLNLFAGTTSPNLTLAGSNTGDNTFAIPLTSGVNLVKNGPGTWLLSGSNSHTGGTTINAGTLKLGSATALGGAGGTAGVVAFGAGSTGKLALNGNNATVSILTTNATVGTPVVENGLANTTSTLTVNAATAQTYAGVLQNGAAGTLALLKNGTSTLTLSGENTFTGTTTVAAGVLALAYANALQNSALVATGAGTVTFTAPGTNTYSLGGLKNDAGTGVSASLSPGANSLALTSGSASSVVIASATNFQGGTAAFELTSAALTLGGGFTTTIGGSYAPGSTRTFNLFDVSGGTTTGNFSSFAIAGNYTANLTQNLGIGFSGFDALGNFFSFDNGTGNLTFTAVPEPHETAVIVAGILLLAVVLRRRRVLARS